MTLSAEVFQVLEAGRRVRSPRNRAAAYPCNSPLHAFIGALGSGALL